MDKAAAAFDGSKWSLGFIETQDLQYSLPDSIKMVNEFDSPGD